jgi:hypothetical protein
LRRHRPGQEIDYLCQIHGLEKAVVVRYDPEAGLLGLVATAALAHNRNRARSPKGDLNSSAKFETAHFHFIPDTEDLELFMSVAMVYQLLK